MTPHAQRDVPRQVVYVWPGSIVEDGIPTLNTFIPDSFGSSPTLWLNDVLTLYLGEDKPLVEIRFREPSGMGGGDRPCG